MIAQIDNVDDTSTFLRKIVRVAVTLADTTDDSVASLKSSIKQIQSIDTQYDDRLASTQEYALRVLRFRQRMYEEMFNRDLSAAPQSKGNQDPKVGGTDTTGGSTGDTDLDAILKLLATQG